MLGPEALRKVKQGCMKVASRVKCVLLKASHCLIVVKST